MQEREVVLTKREVEARLVPAGTEIMIPSDTFVTITQSLGGTFTVAVNGNLAAMVANPEDLISGQQGTGQTVVTTSTKAIRSYREKAPTGAGDLTEVSTNEGG